MHKTLRASAAVVLLSGIAAFGEQPVVTLAFCNAPLDTVVATYGNLSGKTLLRHPGHRRRRVTMWTLCTIR